MGNFYKTKEKQPSLSQADIERIKRIDQNPSEENRKVKVIMVLKNKGISAEVCITCYGKDKEELKRNIQYNVDFFKKADKKWDLLRIEDPYDKSNDSIA